MKTKQHDIDEFMKKAKRICPLIDIIKVDPLNRSVYYVLDKDYRLLYGFDFSIFSFDDALKFIKSAQQQRSCHERNHWKVFEE